MIVLYKGDQKKYIIYKIPTHRGLNIATNNPIIAAPAATPSNATVVMSRWETTLRRSLKRSWASCFQESRERGARSGWVGRRLLLFGRESGSSIGVEGSVSRPGSESGSDVVVVVFGVDSSEGVEVADTVAAAAAAGVVVSPLSCPPFKIPFSLSIASITFSSNPFTNLFLLHGSTAT